jgi:hypothetical protein
LERCQQTRVGNELSEVGALISGVIQGSRIVPLFFVLYVNDMVNVSANGAVCKLYADDVKMYTVIKADTDCAMSQSNLDRLQQLSDRWQLKITYKQEAKQELRWSTLCLFNQMYFNSRSDSPAGSDKAYFLFNKKNYYGFL